jgi:3-hydroxyisobutyrate dehydrogenase-like beta-hydroxyacid dehydrogenase
MAKQQNAEPVGLVGLGLVGQALAGRFLAAGIEVVGYDPDKAAADAARELGARIAGSAAEVAAAARLVLLSLPNSAVVEAVLWGEGRLGAACRPGSVVVDTTTAEPTETVRQAERLAEREVRLVDCALVGSSAEIARGEGLGLLGMADGEVWFVPALRAAIGRLFLLGGCGQGHRAKLVVNLVLGLNRLVLAEGLGLARRCGMDAAALLEILKAGGAYSKVMETKGPAMLARRFAPPAARLAQHAKDVSLILRLGEEAGARLPLSELHHRLLAEAMGRGLGELDNAAVAELFLGQAPPA